MTGTSASRVSEYEHHPPEIVPKAVSTSRLPCSQHSPPRRANGKHTAPTTIISHHFSAGLSILKSGTTRSSTSLTESPLYATASSLSEIYSGTARTKSRMACQTISTQNISKHCATTTNPFRLSRNISIGQPLSKYQKSLFCPVSFLSMSSSIEETTWPEFFLSIKVVASLQRPCSKGPIHR